MRPARAVNHGDYGYVQKTGCKCEPCREARRLYSKGLRLDQARGVNRKVPIARVQAHLLRLIDQGVTRRQIVAATGGRVHRAQVLNIVRGHNHKGNPVRFVHRATAAALLAVTYEQATGQDDVVPAIGIRRRIYALNRIGHTAAELAEVAGISGSMVYELTLAAVAQRSTIGKIHKAYEHLASTPGTNEWVRWRAIRQEHAPPLAWDNDQLDELDGRPDWHWVRCAVDGCPNTHWKTGLCRRHHLVVEGRGGFSNSRRFREVVQSQGQIESRGRTA